VTTKEVSGKRSGTDQERLPLAVLLSGTGRTLKNLLEVAAKPRGNLPLDVRLVISSKPGVRGLEIAAEHGIPTNVICRNSYPSTEAFSHAIFDAIRHVGARYVVFAGFLKHVLIPPDFEHRVINIHPSLIPSFCGQGFYGHRVHEAVIDAGARLTGCTVHFVDNEYDHGPIILQQPVPVLDDDTPELLADRVFEAECLALPQAIRALLAGSVRISGEKVRWS
jgi:phosphoribosylglycinamide formyltransferase 1